MTTKERPHRGVSPTPSKIPIRSQRCPAFPTVKPYSLDQENHDPRRLVQKQNTPRPLVDSAGFRSTALHHGEKSQKLVGSTQPRNPLVELKPSPAGQNVGPGPSAQTEAPGAIEFVADPAALATILSGEGVKSCTLGRQSSMAQRVLVQGSKGGNFRRGQNARCSAYLASKTPVRLDPARASCFSRLEGPGPRGRTLCPQRLKDVDPPLGPSFHPSTRPSLQDLRRQTCSNSRTSVSQTSRLLLETPVQPGDHKVVPHSDEGGGAVLDLAQRVPLRETQEITHTRGSANSHLMPSPALVAQPMPGCVPPFSVTRPSPFGRAQRVPSPGLSSVNSCSLLRRLAVKPRTHFTPMRSLPRVQQAQWRGGLSPQSCPEEPVLPWEQIAVRLFDQDSCVALWEGSGKPSMASTFEPHPSKAPSLQELKMQRISILQQLLRQEVEGLAGSKSVLPAGGSFLDMVGLQPLLSEISSTLNIPEHSSVTSHLLGLSKQSGLPEPCFSEAGREPQLCPQEEIKAAQPCSPIELGPPEPCWRTGREPPESSQKQPEVPEAPPPALPGPLPLSPQEQDGSSEACPRAELGASVAQSLEAGSPESNPQPCCSQGPRASTSLTFSSPSPLCASPPIRSLQSLRSPAGHSGPRSLAPRTLALRQRLKACLTAIHCSHEARLDDECAFYTSRIPPPGPTRVCTNPVAMLLEWQDALCFIPVGSVVPHGSPS